MKRIITAVGVIVMAFAISFTGYFLVDKACKKLENALSEICNTAQDNNIEKSIELSENTVVLWEDVHDTIESFIRHEETDKLEELVKAFPCMPNKATWKGLNNKLIWQLTNYTI